jgi:hypothetical protein
MLPFPLTAKMCLILQTLSLCDASIGWDMTASIYFLVFKTSHGLKEMCMQAGEPVGSQEFSSDKAGGESDDGEKRHDEADAEEEEEESADNEVSDDADKSKRVDSTNYMNDVSEEEDEEEEDMSDEDDELPDVNVNAAKPVLEEAEESSSEREEESDAQSDHGKQKKKNAPKVEDYEDLEEFFVAGGKLEDAKKRKEW